MKSDIFFVITAVSIVLLTVVFLAVLYYIIKILRDVKDISHTAKEETRHIAGDIESVRKTVKLEGKLLKKFGSSFSGWIKRKK